MIANGSCAQPVVTSHQTDLSATKPFGLSWTETETRLRYSLGDFSLFSLRFSARTCAIPLAPLLPASFQSDLEALLKSGDQDVDLLCVRNFPIAKPASAIQFSGGRLQYTLNQCFQYYADLRGNFEDYLGSLSSKTRSTLKRKVKKFASLQNGNIDWRLFKRADQMCDYHDLARQVAVKTYQEKLFKGAVPEGERFRNELLALAAADRIRGYLLFLHDSPVAYLHLPIHNGVVEYAYLGYDPAYAAFSPGAVLLFFALQNLMSEKRFSYFDFSYGAGQTKEVFSTAKYLRADLFYFARSIKYCAVAYSHLALDSISAQLGKTLEHLHVRARLRRALRK